ncbi:MAG: peptidoglycan editing factor PgeF [Candidatus Altimarinota bacterium]
MKKHSIGGLPCYQFHLIDRFSADIEQAVFTRLGGVSKAPYNFLNVRFKIGDEVEAVMENRAKIMKAMKLKQCVSGDQTHSKNVVVVDEKSFGIIFPEEIRTREIADVDGFITNLKGVGLMIQVADCQAILFFDPVHQVIGVAHAGWRGLKANISAEVVRLMGEKFGTVPANLLVGISPSLGPAHSEFSDPLRELGAEFAPFIKERKVDMWAFSKWQLMQLGVMEQKIEIAKIDTADLEEGKRFFSYRREGETGRFALVAALK